MSSQPLISIIIPCYKMGKYIGEALESVGKQSYTNWEVIAVDDCGPEDGTKKIVESFASEHPEHRVEFIRHEENGGVSKARNTAIHAAKGEFLAFLDPDDFWGCSYLASHVKALHSDPSISVSYTDARCIDEEGKVNGHVWGRNGRERFSLSGSLYQRNLINPSTAMARRRSVLSCDGFDESPEIQHVEDWDLWLRMLDEGMHFAYTPLAESFYRQHPVAATADDLSMRKRERALRRKHVDLPARNTVKLLMAMERRMDQIEGRQQAYEGSVFYRLGRLLSKLVCKFRSGS